MRLPALIGVAALGLAVVGCGSSTQTAITQTVTVTHTAPAAPTSTVAQDDSTPDVVARVIPSVVNVKTVGFNGSKGEASGVVIDRHGVILTNDHVVRGARTLTVSFNDGRHRKPVRARVIGTAPERDLAIIRVQLSDLVPLPLGRSSRLRLGDAVLAIGFPLDLGGGPTVTQGIVSGLDRTVHADGGPSLQGLLQTDAAINPGNSGGALVDSTGKLIGINTIAANAGSAENVGFAISIDEARPVIDEIRSKPASQRAWIGVTFDSIASAAAAVQIGLQPNTRGAVVVAVFSASPGSKGGLKAGDVVVAVDGKAVRSSLDMSKTLAALKPGDSIVARRRRQRRPAAHHREGRQAAGNPARAVKSAFRNARGVWSAWIVLRSGGCARSSRRPQPSVDPDPAHDTSRSRSARGERAPGLRRDAVRLLNRPPACPSSQPTPLLAPDTPAKTRSFRNELHRV